MKNVKPLNAGRLNKKVSIYRYKDIETEMGATRSALVKVRTTYAEVKPVRGTEFLEYFRDANALQFKITMRYKKDLTEKDVIVMDGRQFEINSVINIMEANIYHEVYCTESKDKEVLYG